MGGVFGSATQAPFTAIASVVEMTGNFTLILPVMLAVGTATALSKKLSYGSIYTTKLLRRGIDIERPKANNVLQMLTVADVMLPLPEGHNGLVAPETLPEMGAPNVDTLVNIAGPITETASHKPSTPMRFSNRRFVRSSFTVAPAYR